MIPQQIGDVKLRHAGLARAQHFSRATTQVQDKEITRGIYRRFEGNLALNCFVIESGEIAVGDDVQLVRDRACADSAAAVFAE